MNDMIERDTAFVANTYKRFPVTLDHGKGSLIYNTEGKPYIDMGSGIGVTALGIADDDWVAAVTDQLGKLQHTSNLYYTAPCGELAQKLCERTGMKKVFFSNSGAEANECAIKTARKYAAEHKGADCYTILTLVNSFHGRTVTTLAATGQDTFHRQFLPLTDGFVYAPANDFDALKVAAETHNLAAVMVECVQGEGGVLPLDLTYLQQVAQYCKEHEILLIVDEVQTGNGRTGTLYAYEQYDITPDIVTTAKGLGGGLPIGATLFGEKCENTLGFGEHGSTYGGNPVACAGALAVLNKLDDTLLASVRRKSAYIFDQLEGAKGVLSVSGKGLMIGIETVRPAADVVRDCMERGVLCLTAKTKVRLLPALTISDELLEQAITTIKTVCGEGL